MRNFNDVKKMVIKIGTNTLSKSKSIEIDDAYIKQIAKQVVQLRRKDIKVVIVTSGAIGMGAGHLGITKINGAKERQACAAVGQPLLMDAYKKAFSRQKIKIAQVLLTSHVLDKSETYKNLRNAIDQLLAMDIIPILNENDCVSTEEIDMAFGDNDKLSARVASKIEADLLILLSDVEGFYDRDPRINKTAKKIDIIDKLTKKIINSAGEKGTKHATGGMKSKIEAVKIAFDAGCRIILADGRTEDVLTKIMSGKEIGTLFIPKGVPKLNEHKRWIVNSKAAGRIKVTTVKNKLRKKFKEGEDVLPVDINSVEGVFKKGDVIFINDRFKAIANLDSDKMKQFKGIKQREIRERLGEVSGTIAAIKSEDICKLEIISLPKSEKSSAHTEKTP